MQRTGLWQAKNACDCSGERHNLELWTKHQPSGKRPSDLLQYARDIFLKYGSLDSINELLEAFATKSDK